MWKLLFFIPVYFTGYFTFAQGYRNPVIPGFYPDPSVCAVGDDFYLVNSSFEYFPGIPVWHSKDLIHWEQIGNALNRRSQLTLANARPSNGIYAPTIRWYKGLFYIVVTLVSHDQGYRNFYITSTNPAGPWSDPVYVEQSGIDPSLFWDDNGKAYFLSNRATRSTDPRAIYQSEIDLQTGKLRSAIKPIWTGSGGSYVEGPHMYKKDGYYYLLTAEGGTSYGHMVAIARSRNIWGRYESCPHNPILTNRMTYSVIQGTGHGDLVQAADSSWWMVHLAFRPAVDGIHFIGRETCLTPVEWKKNEWPVVNQTGQTAELITAPTLPLVPMPMPPTSEDFLSNSLSFQWVYLRNPDSACYSLIERKGFLRLKGNAFTINDVAAPVFVGRRQQHFVFTATTSLDFEPLAEKEEAGLILEMTNEHHYDFVITREGDKKVLIVRYRLELLQQTVARVPLSNGPVQLRITGDKKYYSFSFADSSGRFAAVARLNTKFLGTEVTGGYNGVIIGLYASGNGQKSLAMADFDWFTYTGK